MVRRLLAGLGGALVIVLASCSENGLLTPLSDQSSQISIESVANGTMVTSGDQIPLAVKLNSSEATPTVLKVDLLSASGTVVQSADIKDADFSAPLPSVLLSKNLKTGTYTMRLTLDGSNNQVLAQKKVSVFYVDGTYGLDGIASYPPALPPGGSGLIVARVTAPQGANPYLRWSMGDKLIANGYLDDGFDKLPWTAPSSTGVYSITVEMFPFGPPAGSSFDYTSPYKMKVEVFVTTSAKSDRNELGPASSYYALYHFQGNLKDAAAAGQTLEAIGSPTLAVSGSVFGYQLDGSSGFKVGSLLLPVNQKGKLQPASVTMRLRLDKDEPNRQFFRTSTDDGSFSLDMATNNDGELTASVDGTPEPGAVAIKSGDVTSVTLSIIPAEGALTLLWFVDGALSLSDTVPVNSTVNSTSGSTTIAGQDGFIGLIDEFGVFYKDSLGREATDPEVYRRAMEDEYRSNLLFAEGFDGIYLPSDLSYAKEVKRSQLAAGLLGLKAGQSVTLPKIPIGGDDISIAVALTGLSDTGSGVLSLSSNGQVVYSTSLKDAVNKAGDVEVNLSKITGGVKVVADGQNPVVLTGEFPDVVVSVASTGKSAIDLRSFLIAKSRAQLADKHNPGSQSSGTET